MIKHTQPTFHYLLTSIFTWRTGTDLHALMKEMDARKEGTYWVWYVPCAEDTPYEINCYQPQVEGSFVLAEVAPKKRAARKTKAAA